MKLAFTTLGCPGWDMDTIVSKTVEYGFDGVDFRGYLGELNIFKFPEFTSRAEETALKLADANLEVPCFSSSVRIFPKSSSDKAMYFEEIKSYAPLCEIFRTPFIRVFGGKIGNTSWPEAIDTAAENFKNMAAIAEDHNVKILLETHDDWLDSDKLKLLMEKVDSDSAGILWDTHHPYRLIGEGISNTWQTIGKWIKYTHWKDSFIDPNTKRGHKICLVGDGDIPLKEIYSVLRDGNYKGYFTLEWEKKWNPEIEEPEVAFPKYVKVMRELLTTEHIKITEL